MFLGPLVSNERCRRRALRLRAPQQAEYRRGGALDLFSRAATEDDVNNLIWSIRELERDRPGGSDAMDRGPIAQQFRKERDLFLLFATVSGFCVMIKENVGREQLEPLATEAISRSIGTN